MTDIPWTELSKSKDSKKKLYIHVKNIEDVDIQDVSLDSLIKNLTRIKEQYSDHFNLLFEHDRERGYYDSYSDRFFVSGYRLETDEEFNSRQNLLEMDRKERLRIKREKDALEADPEYQMFQKLKGKFGNK